MDPFKNLAMQAPTLYSLVIKLSVMSVLGYFLNDCMFFLGRNKDCIPLNRTVLMLSEHFCLCLEILIWKSLENNHK